MIGFLTLLQQIIKSSSCLKSSPGDKKVQINTFYLQTFLCLQLELNICLIEKKSIQVKKKPTKGLEGQINKSVCTDL